jgi:hypothetical protein
VDHRGRRPVARFHFVNAGLQSAKVYPLKFFPDR